MPIACVDVCELLIELVLITVLVPTVLVAATILYRNATRALARSQSEDSATLYVATAVLTLLWGGSLAVIFGTLNFLAMHGYTLFIALATFGLFVLIMPVLMSAETRQKTSTKEMARASCRKPERFPFQIWAQDLFIALLCYGTGLLILSVPFGFDRGQSSEFLRWSAYVMLAGITGLLFAVDFCRRQDWSQTPQKRAIVFVVVFTLFPLLLPLALIAWYRWRRTLELQAQFAYVRRLG